MLGEQNPVANRLVDFVAIALPGEEPSQALLADSCGDGERILSPTRTCNRIRIEVGRENLQCELARLAIHTFDHGHRQRVSLFAGRATNTPQAQLGTRLFPVQKFRYGGVDQVCPDVGIPEEVGHTDQDLVEQQVHFLRILSQQAGIFAQPAQSVNGNTALDAAIQGAGAILRKVMPGLLMQQRNNGFEGTLV